MSAAGKGGEESHLHCAPVISVLTIPALACFCFLFWSFMKLLFLVSFPYFHPPGSGQGKLLG